MVASGSAGLAFAQTSAHCATGGLCSDPIGPLCVQRIVVETALGSPQMGLVLHYSTLDRLLICTTAM